MNWYDIKEYNTDQVYSVFAESPDDAKSRLIVYILNTIELGTPQLSEGPTPDYIEVE